MFIYNLFNIFILLTFVFITSCGKKDNSFSQKVTTLPIEKNVNLNNSQQPVSYKSEENTVEESNVRRGILSIFFKKSKNKPNISNNNENNVIKNDVLKKESTNNISNTEKINSKLKNNNNEEKIIEESTSYKDSGVIKLLINFVKFFTNDNAIIVKNIKYPVDSLSVRDGLNLAVLKIPNNVNKKENNTYYSEDTKLLKSMPTTISENISPSITNDPMSQYIFGVHKFEDNNINKQSNHNDLSSFDIYKNYFITLKYEGLLTNYNEVVPNKSLSHLHKTLISKLLLKNENTPQVLYIFYRQTNRDMNISTKQQLYLTSYLNNLRSYIYSKKVKNIYIQEVQFIDLPVNEILLILKPISMEQYNILPKQVNVFNADKINMKTWLEINKNIRKNIGKK